MAKSIQLKNSSENVYPIQMPYATEEHIIGKWVDGKPIYRRTIVISINNSNEVFDYDISSLNTDYLNIVDGRFKCFINNIYVEYRMNYYFNSNDFFFGIRRNVNSIRFRFGMSQRLDATNKSITLTIEYTKTTD